MDEQSIEDLMRDAARSYREPPRPPLDAMWDRIERAHFGADPGQSLWRRWLRPALGVAAGLVIGIGIGRASALDPTRDGTMVASAEWDLRTSYRAVTSRYLGQAAALLGALPRATERGPEPVLLERASELLSMTRLLLDSPAADDPQLRILLDDLELVLAQVVTISDQRHAEELALISDALEQRDVLPRLQDAVTHSLP